MEFKRITPLEYEIMRRAMGTPEWRKVSGYDVSGTGTAYRGFSSLEAGELGENLHIALLYSRMPLDPLTWEEGEEVYAAYVGGSMPTRDQIDAEIGITAEAMEAAAAAKPAIVDPVTFVASPPAEPITPGDYHAVTLTGNIPYDSTLSGDVPVGHRSLNDSHYDLFGAFELGAGDITEARLSIAKGTSGSGGDFYIWLGRGDLAAASDPVADIQWETTDILWPLDGSAGFATRMTSPDIAAQVSALLPLSAGERLVVALTARGTSGPTPQSNVYLDDPHHPFTLTVA